MNEIRALLDKQARWQKSRRALSWPEKIRLAVGIRATALKMRETRKAPSDIPKATPP